MASSLMPGEKVGLFLLAGVSGISATAIIGLLSYIAVSFTPPGFSEYPSTVRGARVVFLPKV